MATRLEAPDKSFLALHDSQGTARFAELRHLAKLNAEAAAIVYRVTGVVAQNVEPRLRRWVYGVQKGEVSMGRDFWRMLDVCAGMVSRRLMTVLEARSAAEELLLIGFKMIDVKLPVTSPDRPTLAGRTITQCLDADREKVSERDRPGAGGVLPLFGSDDAPPRAA